jgi:diguanylate cyclase (GGDEF)-like protein
VSRHGAYAAAGAALSLGAPLGLLLLRASQCGEASAAFLQRELLRDSVAYLYVSLSTLVAFAGFGYVLGLQADRLIELSTRDALTGLHNRRALFERLAQELQRARRYAQPISLLLIDVDGLKSLNDRNGHRAGDAALRMVAEAVRSGSRASDLCARWGGDEFAVLAPSTAAEAGMRMAERVRLLVESGSSPGGSRVTASLGVSTIEPGTAVTEPESFVRAADAALYRAKNAGRNRVAFSAWTPEPPVAG